MCVRRRRLLETAVGATSPFLPVPFFLPPVPSFPFLSRLLPFLPLPFFFSLPFFEALQIKLKGWGLGQSGARSPNDFWCILRLKLCTFCQLRSDTFVFLYCTV